MASAWVREERQPCGRKVSRWVGAGMFTQGRCVAEGGAAVSRAGCPGPVLASRCALAPAGRAPPPHAQRGFIKSGCEEAREAAWLQPAGSEPWACRSQASLAWASMPRFPSARQPNSSAPLGSSDGAGRGCSHLFQELEVPGAIWRGDNVRRLLFKCIFLHPRGETQPIGKPKVQNSRKFKGC